MSSDLEQQIEGLRRMSREQLKNRWRARGIAWRWQEAMQGSLSPEARRLLGGSGDTAPRRRRASVRASLRPGNRLVRRWRGRTYLTARFLQNLDRLPLCWTEQDGLLIR